MNKPVALAVLLALGVLASSPASAHGPRGRVHFGVHIGAPLWYYPHYYYPPPRYYYPPVIVQSGPPVYVERPSEFVERPAESAAPESTGWWYYCEQTRGYYPYVKTCPGGWQRVPPAPPAAGG